MEETKTTDIREFTSDEISEISGYIQANVPFSILNMMPLLSEKIDDKMEIYTIVYRIMMTAKNMVKDVKTKEKLNLLLTEGQELYVQLYDLKLKKASKANFGKYILNQKINDIFSSIDKLSIINKLIDYFLVFSEKQVLYSVEEFGGLEQDTEEGRKLYEDVKKDS